MYFIRRQAKQTKMIFHYSYKRRESYRTNMFCIVPAFSFTFYRSTSFKNAPRHLKDATEKVLILRKVAQDKVYLYVLRYYILYVKTVFQWRP